MRIARPVPVVFTWLALVSAYFAPYVYSKAEHRAVALAAVVAVAIAAAGTAVAMHRHVPLRLEPLRASAFRARSGPEPGPLAIERPWRDAWRHALWVAPLLVLGAMNADLATGRTDGGGRFSATVAAITWTGAVVLAAYAVLWPMRLRRAARATPVALDLVGWTVERGGEAWLLAAPAGATSLADVVGIPLRKGTRPPPAFAGPLWVHGDLRPFRVAIVRDPYGAAYWPRGACWGPARLVLRHVDAQARGA